MKVFVMENKHILIKLMYLPRLSTIGSKIIYSERLTVRFGQKLVISDTLGILFKLFKLKVAITFSSLVIVITRRRKKLRFAGAKY